MSNRDNTTKVIVDPNKDKPDSPKRIPALLMTLGPSHLVGQQWPINKKSMTIGRFANSEICIPENSLSKVHARLTTAEGLVVVVDLGSTNGTSLNGKPLTAYMTYQLRHNDQIKAGSVVFKFLDQ